MCDRWPFPACQRWEGEKQREYLTHTPKHTSRASDVFPTALLSDLWLWLADCWVMVECEHTHTHTHTHRCQISDPQTRSSSAWHRFKTEYSYYFCIMDTVCKFSICIEFIDDLKAEVSCQTCICSYIHRNTHTYIYKYAALRSVSATRRQKKERERELEMRLWYWSSSYFYSFIFIMKCFDRFSPLKHIELLKCPNIWC